MYLLHDGHGDGSFKLYVDGVVVCTSKTVEMAFVAMFTSFYVFDIVMLKNHIKSMLFWGKFGCQIEQHTTDLRTKTAHKQCVALMEKLTLKSGRSRKKQHAVSTDTGGNDVSSKDVPDDGGDVAGGETVHGEGKKSGFAARKLKGGVLKENEGKGRKAAGMRREWKGRNKVHGDGIEEEENGKSQRGPLSDLQATKRKKSASVLGDFYFYK